MSGPRPAGYAVAAVLVALGFGALLAPANGLVSHVTFPLLVLGSAALGLQLGHGPVPRWAPLAFACAVGGTLTTANNPEDLIFFPLAAAGTFLGTRRFARDRSAARRLGAHAEDLAVAADRVALDTVAHERTRIARELHDVIAHGINVISLQAGAARLALPDRAQALQALDAAATAGTDALADLGRLTSLLLDDPATAGDPQPRLDELDTLVDRARAAGLDVRVEVRGTPTNLSAGAELAVYRLVQEALTNSLKHAGPARVDLWLTHDGQGLQVEVINPVRVDRVAPTTGSGGHGLVGMRERVALYGGELTTGPRDGTWHVVARFPAGAS